MACFDPNYLTQKFRVEIDKSGYKKAQILSRPSACGRHDDEQFRRTSKARLEHAIETEILPRLMMARKRRSVLAQLQPAPSERGVGPADIERFSHLLIDREIGEAASFVDALRGNGTRLDALYLDLLAPAARRLGALWELDFCCFTDVSLGLCRLHQILNALNPRFLREGDGRWRRRRAVMSTLPGEQHSFGLVMATEFFRRAGWEVIGWPFAAGDRVAEIVRAEAFHLVGLSLSQESQVELAKSIIEGVRRASCNRAISVMVGGRLVNDHPEIVRRIGADGAGGHGLQAVERAENLVAPLARQ